MGEQLAQQDGGVGRGGAGSGALASELGSALDAAIELHEREVRPRLDKLWRYYRNEGGSGRRSGQFEGLPARLRGVRGVRGVGTDDRVGQSREIVIENDIAWRVHTMVDFMFGRPIRLVSTARDEATRSAVEAALDSVWEGSGGISLLQDMGLLGHVFGHVDLVLRADATGLALIRDAGGIDGIGLGSGISQLGDDRGSEVRTGGGSGLRLGDSLRIDVVDPRRGVAVLDEGDYRLIRGYAVHDRSVGPGGPGGPGGSSWLSEVYEPWVRRVERDGVVVEVEEQRLFGGRVPVVHMQNVAQPFRFEGLGEVEPLVGMQDELNTRLSDRASRVTLQSFKMYLARGLEGFESMSVGPGQVWSTDNADASIEAFGGDGSSPSEEAHIREVREAMDKVSGVPPLATGVVQGRVGNLSSANALRITLVGLLSKTARKRVTYGRGISQMSEMVLGVLDAAGVLRTSPADRGIRLEWSDPLPEDALGQTLAAKRKIELGVPADEVLDELGYSHEDQGVV